MQVCLVSSRERAFRGMDVRGFVPQYWVWAGGTDVGTYCVGVDFSLYPVVS
jgi:hypothetical protein